MKDEVIKRALAMLTDLVRGSTSTETGPTFAFCSGCGVLMWSYSDDGKTKWSLCNDCAQRPAAE